LGRPGLYQKHMARRDTQETRSNQLRWGLPTPLIPGSKFCYRAKARFENPVARMPIVPRLRHHQTHNSP